MKKCANKKAILIGIAIVVVLAAVVLFVLFGNSINSQKNDLPNDDTTVQTGDVKQAAEAAYTQYMSAHSDDDASPTEYMIYEANGEFVALHNGVAAGVYASAEEALAALVDTPEEFCAAATDDPSLFLYSRDELPKLTWEVGTIHYWEGVDTPIETCLRTTDYLKFSDYSGFTVNPGYDVAIYIYDPGYVYLGNGTRLRSCYYWLGEGGAKLEDIEVLFPDGGYFRLVVRSNEGTPITVDDLAATGITLYAPGEEVPLPDTDSEPKAVFEYEDYLNVGTWQDGAIWDGKLFLLNESGTGKVFNLETKKPVGALLLDKRDVLKPHSNTVFFGNTKYDENDKYPLMYVSFSKPPANSTEPLDGLCCVYRLTENDGRISTQLVQVIRIGFVEDLDLWKSLPDNQDQRPYGNFVIDTDSEKLYAYVMRERGRTTRFFEFEVPSLDSGTYNETYGCNVVTLNDTEILSQFDTEYFDFIQGCCYNNGQIISVEGYGSASLAEPVLRLIDLETQTVKESYYPGEVGLTAEPEVVCVDPADGTLYYAPKDGMLRKIILPDSSN